MDQRGGGILRGRLVQQGEVLTSLCNAEGGGAV